MSKYKSSIPVWQKKYDPPAEAVALANLYAKHRSQFMQALSDVDFTLCHGDFRLDNLFFDADGNMILTDFQVLKRQVRPNQRIRQSNPR